MLSNRETTLLYLLGIVIVLTIGYAFGRYVQPAKVETRTVTVNHEVEVVKHDVVTVTKEVTTPDGTKTVTTTVTDKTKEETHKDSSNETKTVTDYSKPQWKANAFVSPSNATTGHVYGVSFERRLIGPVFVGIYGNVDRSFGGTVGLEF